MLNGIYSFVAAIGIVVSVHNVNAQESKISPALAHKLSLIPSTRVIIKMHKPEIVAGVASPAANPAAHLALTHSSDKVKNIKSIGIESTLTASISKEGLESLKGDPQVAMVIEDRLSRTFLIDSIKIVDAENSSIEKTGGGGQVIAVLDTGINSNHPFLKNKVIHEACFSSPPDTLSPGDDPALKILRSSLCPSGGKFEEGLGTGKDCSADIHGCDHGTHVAGIIAGAPSIFNAKKMHGVTPAAKIISINVFTRFDDPRFCGAVTPCVLSYASDQLRALDYIYRISSKYKVAAINMSLGSEEHSEPCTSDLLALPPSSDRPVSKENRSIILKLRDKGIATIAASGNDGYTSAIATPACVPGVIAIGALTKTGSIADFSNTSTSVQLFAPGEKIYSSAQAGGFVEKSGTSQATPFVAAAWALLRQSKPNASTDQILNSLRSSGIGVQIPGNGATIPLIQVAKAKEKLNGNLVAQPAIAASTSSQSIQGVSAVTSNSSSQNAIQATSKPIETTIVEVPRGSLEKSNSGKSLTDKVRSTLDSPNAVIPRDEKSVTVVKPGGITEKEHENIKGTFGEGTRIIRNPLAKPQ